LALLIAICVSGGFCSPALSHSGRTDEEGCHGGSVARHCHTPKSFSSKPSRSLNPKTSSKLSSGVNRSSEECSNFTFSEIIRQSDRGNVQLRCGRVLMSIKAHY